MKKRQITTIIFFLMAMVLYLTCRPEKMEYIQNQGLIFGTSYSLMYESPKDYGNEVHQHLMEVVDNSLSTFNPSSIISKINNNEAHQTDSAFEKVYYKAQEISEITRGAFDMTVAPLVNTWGFGYKNKDEILPSDEEIARLKGIVGYQKIRLENHQIIKDFSETTLDASAIAKGFSVDVAADFLEKNNIDNYMVEIGGEIRVKGMNKQGNKWRLGIDKPIEAISSAHRELDTIIHVTDMALATSGNYRQFYYKDGQRYSHTINPISGYPVNHSLLSATVLAPDCMTADAFATACMVMGADKSLKLAETLNSIEIYLIVDNNGNYEEVFTSGFKHYLHP